MPPPFHKLTPIILPESMGPVKGGRSLLNLANLYHDQDRYAEAEPLYERSLAISEKVLGSNHPLVADVLNDTSTLYYDQGRYEKAEPLIMRALKIREKVFGPDHLDVAQSLEHLAAIFRKTERVVAARILEERAVRIRKAIK